MERAEIPISLSSKLRKLTWKRSSYAFNKIEGNPLTFDQEDRAIEEVSRHTLKPEQEIQNYYLALPYLSDQLRERKPFRLSLLLEVQKNVRGPLDLFYWLVLPPDCRTLKRAHWGASSASLVNCLMKWFPFDVARTWTF